MKHRQCFQACDVFVRGDDCWNAQDHAAGIPHLDGQKNAAEIQLKLGEETPQTEYDAAVALLHLRALNRRIHLAREMQTHVVRSFLSGNRREKVIARLKVQAHRKTRRHGLIVSFLRRDVHRGRRALGHVAFLDRSPFTGGGNRTHIAVPTNLLTTEALYHSATEVLIEFDKYFGSRVV